MGNWQIYNCQLFGYHVFYGQALYSIFPSARESTCVNGDLEFYMFNDITYLNIWFNDKLTTYLPHSE